MELFLAKKGYDATTTNDICAAAGITKPRLSIIMQRVKRHLFYLLHMETIDKQTLTPISKKSRP